VNGGGDGNQTFVQLVVYNVGNNAVVPLLHKNFLRASGGRMRSAVRKVQNNKIIIPVCRDLDQGLRLKISIGQDYVVPRCIQRNASSTSSFSSVTVAIGA
jgi:hypothetical protein